MMKTIKHLLCCAIAASALISTGVHAASWKDALSSAASELGNQNNTTQEGGWSLASLTNLLSNGNQALSADNMNNAAGILQYCARAKAGFGNRCRKHQESGTGKTGPEQ